MMSASTAATPVHGPGPSSSSSHKPANTAVAILDALAHRWSPYRFHADRDVSGEDLTGLLEAARWAPSSFGEEPWRFIVARRGDPHRTALEETLVDGNAYAKRASVLIATLAKGTFSRNGKPNRVALHDVGLATGNLLAEATARGLITHPMGGFDKEALREAFGVPEDFTPVTVLAIGHYDPDLTDEALSRRDARERRRRPLEEIAYGRGFGVPFRT